MNYRTLKREDYRKYIELMTQFRPINNHNIELYKTTLDKIKQNGDIIICEKEEKIIGSIKLNIEYKIINNFAKYGYIEDVFVNPNFRKMGIAKKLIDLGILYLKSEDCFKIKLTCSDDLIEYYNKFGFKKKENSMVKFFN